MSKAENKLAMVKVGKIIFRVKERAELRKAQLCSGNRRETYIGHEEQRDGLE